jgi:hypothetical protein
MRSRMENKSGELAAAISTHSSRLLYGVCSVVTYSSSTIVRSSSVLIAVSIVFKLDNIDIAGFNYQDMDNLRIDSDDDSIDV